MGDVNVAVSTCPSTDAGRARTARANNTRTGRIFIIAIVIVQNAIRRPQAHRTEKVAQTCI
jgi:hypothetical protein